MNPQNGNGWPPSGGSSLSQLNAEHQNQPQHRHHGSFGPVHQSNPSLGAPPLISQSSPFYAGQATNHALPTPVGMTQGSPLPAGRVQPAQQQSSPNAIQQSHPVPNPGFTLPSLGTTLHQAQRAGPMDIDRDQAGRERDREIELSRQRHMLVQQEYEREREAQEQQQRQQPEHRDTHQSPLTNHVGPLQIAQPTPRMTATLHGPNGILNHQNISANALPQVNGSSVSASGGQGQFINGIRPSETSPRSFTQNATPSLTQQSSMVAYTNGGAQQQVPTGLVASLSQGGQQPILTDALQYLDQVKVRFVDQPDVYNQFLDIMKDFKSQHIETPGVINRVSMLFAGNPELIEGFNTFLPPGYAIKCGLEGEDSIRVTTPQGTVATTQGALTRLPGGPFATADGNNMAARSLIAGIPNGRPDWHDRIEANDENTSTSARNGVPSPYQPRQAVDLVRQIRLDGNDQVSAENAILHQREQQGVSDLTQATSMAINGASAQHSLSQVAALEQQQTLGEGSSAGIDTPSSLAAAQYGQERKGPVEFNHAIGYVNKIKTRYSANPDIYKAFLEILQTYQKESRPIGDVYAQVTTLFHGAPDLLQDFKQFLPESAAQAKASQAAAAQRATDEPAPVSNLRGGDPSYSSAPTPAQAHTPRPEMKMPPVGNFAPPPSVGKENKKRRGGAGSQMAGGAAAPDSTSGSLHRGEKGQNIRGGGSLSKKPRLDQPKTAVPEVVPGSPTLVPALPRPMPPLQDGGGRADDLAFFDKVKKLLANKTTYNEFLKLCNMYSQEILDEATLKQRMQGFIGSSSELKQAMKRFFPQADPINVIENRPSKEGKRVKLSNCRGLGPSYRLVPNAIRAEQCTGRDEMCKSVLNDEWASFPTWASEDSGFVAHRKNVFEEAIHRCEEERHDYDHNMEACQKTLQIMEQILQHINTLPQEEQAHYRLPRPMGGLSEAIWKRVIKKIYGRTHGEQVVEALYSHPSKVMPLLIWRLRQKLEEWKTSYREWDKVWREQNMKLFYRSLDHQILTAKSLDKRQFQPKTLQAEITIKHQQQQRSRITNSLLPNFQLAYTFNDQDLILDASHMILSFLRYDSAGVVGEESRTEQFIKAFVPTFFEIDQDAFNNRMKDIDEDEFMDEGSDRSAPAAVRRNNPPVVNGVGPGQGEGDASKDSKEGSPTAMDIDSAEVEARGMTNESSRRNDPTEYRWTEHAPITSEDGREMSVNEPFHRDTFNLYGNANIYCFFRLFQMLCERLAHLKANEAEVHEEVRRANIPREADELGINDKPVSTYFEDDSPSANYYKQVIATCEEVIKGKLEMPDLEELLRRFYIQKGWMLQSIKQLLSSLARYASLIITSDSKDKSLDIVNLFYRDRNNEKTTHEAELSYRKQVEKFTKDGDIYRITYNTTTQVSTIQLLRRDALTFNYPSLPSLQRWQAYVASYQMLDETEGLNISDMQYPLLKRNLQASASAPLPPISSKPSNTGKAGRSEDGEKETNGKGSRKERTEEELNDIFKPQLNEDGLQIRVGQGRYKLEYTKGTADWHVHSRRVRARDIPSLPSPVPSPDTDNVPPEPAPTTEGVDAGTNDPDSSKIIPDPDTTLAPDPETQEDRQASATAAAKALLQPSPATTSDDSLLKAKQQQPAAAARALPRNTINRNSLRKKTFLDTFVKREKSIEETSTSGGRRSAPPIVQGLLDKTTREKLTREWERMIR